MKSRQEKTQAEIDAAKTVARHGLAEKFFHMMAKVFNGFHWAIGMTALPATATPREERSFVLTWLGIIVFMIVFLGVFVYVLGTI